MLIPNHPDPERISALVSGDSEAAADRTLTDHVATCTRCTDLMGELGALRASLATLPDLRPSRPLRLLPEVEPSTTSVDGIAGWARRLFAPVLTAGAALAMVGMIGTAGPALVGMGAQAGASAPSALEHQTSRAIYGAASPSSEAQPAYGAADSETPSDQATRPGAFASQPPAASVGASEQVFGSGRDNEGGAAAGDNGANQALTTSVPRSPWPMVLFTGVALMIAAALLRWILAPRAG